MCTILLISTLLLLNVSVLSLSQFLLVIIVSVKLLVLNCYIYKFRMILKLPISHRYPTAIPDISNIGP
ncbi:hypothetical protein Hanom_Chr06g00487631 [Helianthus anomalus]